MGGGMQVVVKSIMLLAVAVMILVVVLGGVPVSEAAAAISCSTVVSYVSPCVPYVAGSGPRPPGRCCGGVRGLYGAARTTADRQTVCRCLKSLAVRFGGPAIAKAGGLPGQCGVSIPYKISPNTDCNKVR